MKKTFFCFFFLVISLKNEAQQHIASSQLDLVLQKIQDVFFPEGQGLDLKIGLTPRQRIPCPAWFDAELKYIFVEENALTICRQMGKDSSTALTALIAHEYIHALRKHGKKRGFTCAFYKKDDDLEEKRGQEEEADLMGFFAAYLAGYPAQVVVPDFLTKIYTAYRLGESQLGYPSLEVRQKYAKKALQRDEQFQDIFEAGNYCSAIGEQEAAAACYRSILADFASAPLSNNLGVVLSKQAISLMDASENQFIYPFELDMDAKWATRRKPLGFSPTGKAKLLLEEAESNFKKAIAWKKNYPSAQLNLACVLSLLGKKRQATQQMAKAETFFPKNDPSINLLRGILFFQNGDTIAATNQFSKLTDLPAAQHNLLALKNQNNSIIQQTNAWPSDEICDEPLKEGWNAVPSLTLTHDFKLSVKKNNCFKAFYLQKKGTRYKVFIQKTKDKAQRTLQDYGIGILLQDNDTFIEKTAISHGFFVCNTQKSLFFKINEENIVEEWGVFSIFEP
jgi:hypothetical protein